MKITLSSSAVFFDKLIVIKTVLENRGYEIFLPSMEDFHKRYPNISETAFAKIHYGLMKDHFKKIELSDALYVANYDKNNISGYIGGSCFLEMGKAFDSKIPIFLLQDVPVCNYREELLALQPIVVGEDWEKLEEILIKAHINLHNH